MSVFPASPRCRFVLRVSTPASLSGDWRGGESVGMGLALPRRVRARPQNSADLQVSTQAEPRTAPAAWHGHPARDRVRRALAHRRAIFPSPRGEGGRRRRRGPHVLQVVGMRGCFRSPRITAPNNVQRVTRICRYRDGGVFFERGCGEPASGQEV